MPSSSSPISEGPIFTGFTGQQSRHFYISTHSAGYNVCYWIKYSHSPELWLWWWRSNAGGCCCPINCWAQASDNSAARSQASLTICQEEVQAAQHFRIFSLNLHGFKQMWALNLNTHELEQVVIRRWWDGQGRGGSYLGTDYGRREEAGWLINYWRKCGTLWNIRHDIIWNKNITRLNTPSITHSPASRLAPRIILNVRRKRRPNCRVDKNPIKTGLEYYEGMKPSYPWHQLCDGLQETQFASQHVVRGCPPAPTQ